MSEPHRPHPLQRREGEEPLFILEALKELPAGALVLDAGAKIGSFPYAAFPDLRILSFDLEIPGTPTPLPHVLRGYGDLLHLPLPDNSLDMLVCYYVIEHVDDPAQAFAEAARVVKPGGLFFASVPESTRFDDRFYRFAGLSAKYLLGKIRKHPEHKGLTTLPRMLRWMYGAGFRLRSYAELPAGFSWMNDPRTQAAQYGFISALWSWQRLTGADPVSRSNLMFLCEKTATRGVRRVTHTCRRCGNFVDIEPAARDGAEWTCPYCATNNRLHRVPHDSV